MYKVELAKSAARDLERIYRADKKIYRRIIAAFEALAGDPFLGKALTGQLRGYYSDRIGVYRVIYIIQHARLLVSVIDIGHRKDVYSKGGKFS